MVMFDYFFTSITGVWQPILVVGIFGVAGIVAFHYRRLSRMANLSRVTDNKTVHSSTAEGEGTAEGKGGEGAPDNKVHPFQAASSPDAAKNGVATRRWYK